MSTTQSQALPSANIKRQGKDTFILSSGAASYTFSVAGFAKMAVADTEDGGAALMGHHFVDDAGKVLAKFTNRKLAEKALKRIVTLSTQRWTRWIFRAIYLLVGFATLSLALSIAAGIAQAHEEEVAGTVPAAEMSASAPQAQAASSPIPQVTSAPGAFVPELAVPSLGQQALDCNE